MNNNVRKGFSISGLLAFSPEHQYNHRADVKLLQTELPNNVLDTTFKVDKTHYDDHGDIENSIKFVNLRSVENVLPRVNSKMVYD